MRTFMYLVYGHMRLAASEGRDVVHTYIHGPDKIRHTSASAGSASAGVGSIHKLPTLFFFFFNSQAPFAYACWS